MESKPPSAGLSRLVDRRLLVRGGIAAGVAAAVALPARRLFAPAAVAEPVKVGGLAVTCNLTLPVACAANQAANPFGSPDGAEVDYEKAAEQLNLPRDFSQFLK